MPRGIPKHKEVAQATEHSVLDAKYMALSKSYIDLVRDHEQLKIMLAEAMLAWKMSQGKGTNGHS